MKKLLFLILGIVFCINIANCKSVSKTKVGGQEVIVYDEAKLSFFWADKNPIGACVENVGKEGATKVISVNGNRRTPTWALLASTATGGTTDTPMCSAVGTK